MNSTLNADYWENRYREADHPWDVGSITPAIKDYVDQLPRKDLRILVPGCGFGYEVAYLAKRGFANVTCIDLVAEVFEKNELLSSPVNCVVGDFFKHSGKYDLILEQTFFCALSPALRADYAAKTAEFLADNGKLVGVLFNMVKTDKPPFGGLQDEYERLFAPYYTFKTFETCRNSVSTRREFFINFKRKS